MFKVIEAINEPTKADYFYRISGGPIKLSAKYAAQDYSFSEMRSTLFLAGGISNCSDWQKYFINMIKMEYYHYSPDSHYSLLCLNPRRSTFDVNNPKESELQIKWEFDRLKESDNIVFWFPQETLCPITLFEYGKHFTDRNKRLFVGTHKNYKRRFDIVYQTKLERPDIIIHDNLDSLIEEVVQEVCINKYNKV